MLPDDQAELFEKDRKSLIGGVPFRGIEFYLPLLHSDAASLLEYLPRDAVIAFDDGDEIADTWSEWEEQAVDLRHRLACPQQGVTPQPLAVADPRRQRQLTILSSQMRTAESLVQILIGRLGALEGAVHIEDGETQDGQRRAPGEG